MIYLQRRSARFGHLPRRLHTTRKDEQPATRYKQDYRATPQGVVFLYTGFTNNAVVNYLL